MRAKLEIANAQKQIGRHQVWLLSGGLGQHGYRLAILAQQVMGQSQVDLRFYQAGAQAQDFGKLGDRQFQLPTFHRVLPRLKVGDDGLLGRLLGEKRWRGEEGGTNQWEQERMKHRNHEFELPWQVMGQPLGAKARLAVSSS